MNNPNTKEIGGMFGQVWYTIGDQLNYRWVDITSACCCHKYEKLLGSSWATCELILQLPVVITNTAHYRGAVELQVSWYCSCLLLSRIWHTIGAQLNYRWVDIASTSCYHKYGTFWRAVELQVSWYCSCLLLPQIWYIIGMQLNYRWIDIACACCCHKYGTL